MSKQKYLLIFSLFGISLSHCYSQSKLNPLVGINSSLFYYGSSNYYLNSCFSVGLSYDKRYRLMGQFGYTEITKIHSNFSDNERISYLNGLVSGQVRLLNRDYRFSPTAEVNFGWGGKSKNYEVPISGDFIVLPPNHPSIGGYFQKIALFVESKVLLECTLGDFNLQTGIGWRMNQVEYRTIFQNLSNPYRVRAGGWIVSAGVQYVIPMKGK